MGRVPKGRILGSVLLLGLLSACDGSSKTPRSEPVRSRYVAGQVWSYETRPGEERSRIHVVKVEHHPERGVMVHVQVDGLKIPNPGSKSEEDRFIRVITHMPMSAKAMDASVKERLLENQPIPHYEAGYNAWKKAFLAGEATVFEEPVATKLQEYENAVASARRKDP